MRRPVERDYWIIPVRAGVLWLTVTMLFGLLWGGYIAWTLRFWIDCSTSVEASPKPLPLSPVS